MLYEVITDHFADLGEVIDRSWLLGRKKSECVWTERDYRACEWISKELQFGILLPNQTPWRRDYAFSVEWS